MNEYWSLGPSSEPWTRRMWVEVIVFTIAYNALAYFACQAT